MKRNLPIKRQRIGMIDEIFSQWEGPIDEFVEFPSSYLSLVGKDGKVVTVAATFEDLKKQIPAELQKR